MIFSSSPGKQFCGHTDLLNMKVEGDILKNIQSKLLCTINGK